MTLRPLSCILLVMTAVVLVGCGADKQAEPPPIQELEMYTDNILNFGIKHPAGWQRAVDPGKQAIFFSDNLVAERFLRYEAEGPGGAKVQIMVQPLTGTLEEVIENNKAFEQSVYTPVEDVTVADVPAKKIGYSFDLGDGKFQGVKYIAARDSFVTIVEFEAFGGTFDALKPKFDEMLQSVQLAHKVEAPAVDTAAQAVAPADTFKPSSQVRTYKGNGYTLDIPDNFSSSPVNTGGAISATKFKGVGGPADSFIQVDVLDASKQNNIDKIAEQNKDVYRTSPNQTTIGGQKAYSFTYTPVKDVSSRAYFVVKGNKLYRITLNWYKPEQNIYLPAFEQVVRSFKFQ